MACVDGFLVPVPKERKEDYKAFAERWVSFFKEPGAIQIFEFWGDGIPLGTKTDFSKSVAVKPAETVVFSWMIWRHKPARDAA